LASTGLVAPGEVVTDVQVCLDGICKTERYSPGYLILVRPPDRHRIRTMRVTTMDDGRVVRVLTDVDIYLPDPKKSHGPCGCHARRLEWNPAHAGFDVVRT
jgi:hypothetical protein